MLIAWSGSVLGGLEGQQFNTPEWFFYGMHSWLASFP
jgi:hypothetical protein